MARMTKEQIAMRLAEIQNKDEKLRTVEDYEFVIKKVPDGWTEFINLTPSLSSDALQVHNAAFLSAVGKMEAGKVASFVNQYVKTIIDKGFESRAVDTLVATGKQLMVEYPEVFTEGSELTEKMNNMLNAAQASGRVIAGRDAEKAKALQSELDELKAKAKENTLTAEESKRLADLEDFARKLVNVSIKNIGGEPLAEGESVSSELLQAAIENFDFNSNLLDRIIPGLYNGVDPEAAVQKINSDREMFDKLAQVVGKDLTAEQMLMQVASDKALADKVRQNLTIEQLENFNGILDGNNISQDLQDRFPGVDAKKAMELYSQLSAKLDGKELDADVLASNQAQIDMMHRVFGEQVTAEQIIDNYNANKNLVESFNRAFGGASVDSVLYNYNLLLQNDQKMKQALKTDSIEQVFANNEAYKKIVEDWTDKNGVVNVPTTGTVTKIKRENKVLKGIVMGLAGGATALAIATACKACDTMNQSYVEEKDPGEIVFVLNEANLDKSLLDAQQTGFEFVVGDVAEKSSVKDAQEATIATEQAEADSEVKYTVGWASSDYNIVLSDAGVAKYNSTAEAVIEYTDFADYNSASSFVSAYAAEYAPADLVLSANSISPELFRHDGNNMLTWTESKITLSAEGVAKYNDYVNYVKANPNASNADIKKNVGTADVFDFANASQALQFGAVEYPAFVSEMANDFKDQLDETQKKYAESVESKLDLLSLSAENLKYETNNVAGKDVYSVTVGDQTVNLSKAGKDHYDLFVAGQNNNRIAVADFSSVEDADTYVDAYLKDFGSDINEIRKTYVDGLNDILAEIGVTHNEVNVETDENGNSVVDLAYIDQNGDTQTITVTLSEDGAQKVNAGDTTVFSTDSFADFSNAKDFVRYHVITGKLSEDQLAEANGKLSQIQELVGANSFDEIINTIKQILENYSNNGNSNSDVSNGNHSQNNNASDVSSGENTNKNPGGKPDSEKDPSHNNVWGE